MLGFAVLKAPYLDFDWSILSHNLLNYEILHFDSLIFTIIKLTTPTLHFHFIEN